jgi:transcriptional regulator with XRE-family HTH domain
MRTKTFHRRKRFNEDVIDVVRALRKVKGVKQAMIASALSMTESNYCKIERHYKEISIGELYVVADQLGSSVRKIVFLAEAIGTDDLLARPIEAIIIMLNSEGTFNIMRDFENDDLFRILTRIIDTRRRRYPSLDDDDVTKSSVEETLCA